MNRKLASAFRDLARAANAIAAELGPSDPDDTDEFIPPSDEEIEQSAELQRALSRIESIQLEGALSRALNPFTRRRTPRA